MENKSNKGLIVLVVILIILVVGLSAYIFCDKKLNLFSKEEQKEIKEETENTDFDVAQFENIIDNELKFLISKRNINELTDSDKSYMIMRLYAGDDFSISENIAKEQLDNAKNNSSLRNLKINYTDIKDVNDYGIFPFGDELIYKYDSEKQQYQNVVKGHGGNSVGIAYKKLTNSSANNNKYTLSYQYVFCASIGDGPQPVNLYYTIEDVSSKKNEFKTFELVWDETNLKYSDNKNEVKTYAQDNYSSISNKLDTYNYVFEKDTNGNIILLDFYRS